MRRRRHRRGRTRLRGHTTRGGLPCPPARINGVQLYWELSAGAASPSSWCTAPGATTTTGRRWCPALSSSLARRDLRPPRPQPQRAPCRARAASTRTWRTWPALIEHLFGGPAHVVGNSFGAAISLRLAVAASGTDPQPGRARAAAVRPARRRGRESSRRWLPCANASRPWSPLLQAGDMRGGARRFVETIAFGPGAWDAVAAGHARHVHLQCADLAGRAAGARIADRWTWSDWPSFHGARPAEPGRAEPALLPGWWWSAWPRRCRTRARYRFEQAGHVPHLSHPDEYVRVVTDFIQSSAHALLPKAPPAASAA